LEKYVREKMKDLVVTPSKKLGAVSDGDWFSSCVILFYVTFSKTIV
jgi:hypothetical protein